MICSVSSWWARQGVSGRVLSNSKAVSQVRDGFCMRRTLRGLLPRQLKILDRLLGVATATVVMRQVAVVLISVAMYKRFQRLTVRSCKQLALLLQYRAVGHVLGQRMLKDVLDLGKRGLLVEKLFALQRRQQAIRVVFGLGDDLGTRLRGKLPANHRELL